ncbi:MAG: sigma-54-dependent Fis family transcriptional regulator [Acidobacteria bacterium]|nr:sigma-54-dependent Fis family transcriptional regulator [Acidobacteriota bacterium]
MPNSVLIVDDEAGIRRTLAGVLEDEGFVVETAASGEACLEAFERRVYSCVLLDVWLPGMDGIETLEKLRAAYPETAVLMISGHGNIETAVRATRLGALDFIEKPLQIERTVIAISNALRQRQLEADNQRLREQLEDEYAMVGESISMRALRQQLALAAPTNGRVLIYGESGTGKELAAHALHRLSRRATLPFVELNCAAIPEELIESELFGHTKGAFTGATQAKRGKFEQADGGTLFLDEVGDMSLKVQAKVLRVLEEQRFEPVGANATTAVDVRIIAATNKRLDEEIERGAFRADLFYRLNVIPFEVPPLRERVEDVPLLIDYFNQKYSAEYNRAPKIFEPEALDLLAAHQWPGNVRELRNIVERVVIMTARTIIRAEDLPALTTTDEALPTRFTFASYKEGRDAFERNYILRKLAECEGNITRTAEAMGYDRSHLYRRMKALGINGKPATGQN